MKTILQKLFSARLFTGIVSIIALAVPGTACADKITYYHNDLLGSPVAATNDTGQVIWHERYGPYGDRQLLEAASAKDNIWFTSRHEDENTELVYMGARYYDPVIGRFMSTDARGFDEVNIHSFNRYAYALNNPYKYVDPDGKWVAPAVALIVEYGPYLITAAAAWGIFNSQNGPPSADPKKKMESAEKGGNSAAASGSGAPDPDEPDSKNKQPEAKRIHTDQTIKSSNKSSYEFWSKKSNEEIVKSLQPGQEEPLMVKPDGRILQGNTRTLILEERGFNINSLPRTGSP